MVTKEDRNESSCLVVGETINRINAFCGGDRAINHGTAFYNTGLVWIGSRFRQHSWEEMNESLTRTPDCFAVLTPHGARAQGKAVAPLPK